MKPTPNSTPAADPRRLSRDEWVTLFASELQRLRGLWHSGKFVQALAQQEWVAHQAEDPEQAAREWAARQPSAGG